MYLQFYMLQTCLQAEIMIEEVKTAFKNNLPNLKWMDSETMAAAVDKVGVQSQWVTFSVRVWDHNNVHLKVIDQTEVSYVSATQKIAIETSRFLETNVPYFQNTYS